MLLPASCTATPDDLDDRPRARFDTIEERTGSYGPVSIGNREARYPDASFALDKKRRVTVFESRARGLDDARGRR